MWKNKVIWSEGSFLQSQHFQQQERYIESVLDHRVRSLHSYGWGFTDIVLDQSTLPHGQISILSASGILPDGTPFNFPDEDAPPIPLRIDNEIKDSVVYLVLPLARPGVASVSIDKPVQPSMHRFISYVQEIKDCNDGFHDSAPLQLGKLDLRIMLQTQHADAYAKLAVARVIEKKANGAVTLDAGFIPPLLAVSASSPLQSWLKEVSGLISQRSEVLAQRMTHPGKGGMAEVADFLFLMIVNRYSRLLNHLIDLPRLHPERLYSLCIEMAGEFSSFTKDRRLVRDFPAYNHDALDLTFRPVMEQLRLAFSMVLEQNAIQIELHDRKYGVRVAVINDKQLIQSASFVLAVHAQLPAEAVRVRFPTQVKIGTIEKIRDLVNLQLQGVPLRALPVAPRQIPFHAGFNYFELDKENDLWRSLTISGGLAMHISGEFPGLELELWAIRH